MDAQRRPASSGQSATSEFGWASVCGAYGRGADTLDSQLRITRLKSNCALANGPPGTLLFRVITDSAGPQEKVEGWKTREQMELDEARILAPAAQKSGESRGRQYGEPQHPYRTEFQRDRARVIHARAFRRLEYKTQVFLNGTGDHLRTRLTHSIEVASISRTIARALGLNEDLAEAIALGHDLGHSPFGHSGEEMLAECMRDHGGFDHNRQSLRVVELLEDPYPDFPGLNLSFEVREGLKKHDTLFEAEPSY